MIFVEKFVLFYGSCLSVIKVFHNAAIEQNNDKSVRVLGHLFTVSDKEAFSFIHF
jgi:hypothetical protein